MATASNAPQEGQDSNTGGVQRSHSLLAKSLSRGRLRHRSYSDSEGSEAGASHIRLISRALFHEDTTSDKSPPVGTKPSPVGDEVAALVDFLKTQPPPSSSFTSTPYDGDEDGLAGGRWRKLKLIGKRSKPVPKPQPQIRLPDSAVSGTTTGGHRHIAISIPLDASPFGSVPRSQYPVVPPQTGTTPSKSHSPSVRTFVNDKGVVSVLRTVSEDGDSPYVHRRPSSSPGPNPGPSAVGFRSQPRIPGAKTQPPPNQRVKPPPPGTYSRPQPLDAARPQYRYSRGMPSPTESLLLADADSAYPDTIEEEEQEQDGSSPEVAAPRTVQQRSAYPTRFSSAAYSRGVHMTYSIDNIISQRPGKPDSLLDSNDIMGQQPSPVEPTPAEPSPVEKSSVQQPSIEQSSIEPSSAEQPCVEQSSVEPPFAEPASQTMSSPAVSTISDPIVDIAASDSAPNVSPETRPDAPNPPRLQKSRSRKDLVKDRKKRDMEAARTARLTLAPRPSEDGGEPIHTANNDEGETRDTRTEGSKDEGVAGSNKQESPVPSEGALQAPSRPRVRLSPVMVVIDEEPSTPTRSEMDTSIQRSATGHLAIDAKSNASSGLDETGNPTPPESNQGSPSHKYNAHDRTALSRRREWNAMREGEPVAGQGRLASGLKNGRPEDRTTAVPYEPADAGREQRLLEMERRLWRLERNGDVWLRALIPMLESMSHGLTSGGGDDLRDGEDRSWASDEVPDEAAGRRGGAYDWDRAVPDTRSPGKRPLSFAPGEPGSPALSTNATYGNRNGLATLASLVRAPSEEMQCRPGTA